MNSTTSQPHTWSRMDVEKPVKISGPALKRLQKEFQSFATSPPDGLRLCEETLKAENLGVWQVKFIATLYMLWYHKMQYIFFKY